MARSLSANLYNRQVWEDAEFPILCATCLGENPYLRMMKDKHGQECKICTRPFTIFRWCPGARMRYKKTEICQSCSRLKNVCQTCLFDLEYGLPVEVRDKALKIEDDAPRSDVNKEYHLQNVEQTLAESDPTQPAGQLGKTQPPSNMLRKLARTTPYYKRNRPHICSFWVKGTCTRGAECPYRHEKPSDPLDPLSDQNMKDRYYGLNDPVAAKLLNRYDEYPKIEPPEDKGVTTLYVGGVGEDITEEDLRNQFYQYGELRSISVLVKQQCAFVQFTSRSGAEKAAKGAYDKLNVRGKRLSLRWGKPQAQRDQLNQSERDQRRLQPVPGLPKPLPAASGSDFFNLMPPSELPPPPVPGMMAPRNIRAMAPPPAAQPNVGVLKPMFGVKVAPPMVHYPSQDPSRMGAVS